MILKLKRIKKLQIKKSFNLRILTKDLHENAGFFVLDNAV